MQFSLSYLISIFYIILITSETTAFSPKRPNLYIWLAQNSYICDPTLLNKRTHRFLTPWESVRLRCSCGDPLATKSACGRKHGNSNQKLACFRLPDPCLREYAVIFEHGGNRLSVPLPPSKPHRIVTAVRKTVTTKHSQRTPKIVSTIPVGAVLRVKKVKEKL
ncbi:uncharacterized protein CELE_ZK1321.1 [Caenorhabditis elegans]|uniref:Uncharacterized protein ZK1321.1 n=1 Tax=Caenorhabditis elegans TaxID=6239 RepID=YS31_CAEEL|nr:Uncharacterized protein CELE_ZK1321.1 [Caenorhabditis elegans]Q09368.2 RecName: Full=Uncharacterized protein ZK1321.1 [Caenorhabditis elegans]CAA88475.2 Uncharacterized protein CELE_ZK1321.1 [Caenorhabditis elegans]|eukprot:NP_496103.2 Uncharacterized protein CELE_ZK1321.1 [Caenorhabditis elegans]